MFMFWLCCFGLCITRWRTCAPRSDYPISNAMFGWFHTLAGVTLVCVWVGVSGSVYIQTDATVHVHTRCTCALNACLKVTACARQPAPRKTAQRPTAARRVIHQQTPTIIFHSITLSRIRYSIYLTHSDSLNIPSQNKTYTPDCFDLQVRALSVVYASYVDDLWMLCESIQVALSQHPSPREYRRILFAPRRGSCVLWIAFDDVVSAIEADAPDYYYDGAACKQRNAPDRQTRWPGRQEAGDKMAMPVSRITQHNIMTCDCHKLHISCLYYSLN